MRDAVQRYLVIVIKGQQHETPYKNWDLLKRLDPEAPEFTDEEWSKMYHPEGQGIGVSLHHCNDPEDLSVVLWLTDVMLCRPN